MLVFVFIHNCDPSMDVLSELYHWHSAYRPQTVSFHPFIHDFVLTFQTGSFHPFIALTPSTLLVCQ